MFPPILSSPTCARLVRALWHGVRCSPCPRSAVRSDACPAAALLLPACVCPHSRPGPMHQGLAFLLVVHRHAVRAGLSARRSTRSRGQVADESQRVFVTAGPLGLLLPVRPAMTVPCMREPHMSDTMATSSLATTLAVRLPTPSAWPLSFHSEPWSVPLRLARLGSDRCPWGWFSGCERAPCP